MQTSLSMVFRLHPLLPLLSTTDPPSSLQIYGPADRLEDISELVANLPVPSAGSHRPGSSGLGSGQSGRQAESVYLATGRRQLLICLTSDFYGPTQLAWFGLPRRAVDAEVDTNWVQLSSSRGKGDEKADPNADDYDFEEDEYPASSVEAGGRRGARLRQTRRLLLKLEPHDKAEAESDTGYPWKALECRAISSREDDRKKPHEFRERRRVELYEPPGVPKVTGLTSKSLIPAGTRVTLRCEARTGHPPAELLWFEGRSQRKMLFSNINSIDNLFI
ncbi:unnamed protein product [Protopolystoma xenopodis]|uniref:Ig-like domain-containing protein n=1 Tax=Protopolystoma xenopodis TaxID=117903 RepID=A0A3S5FFN4_9PLAT|nr:unnamed protein product [Protopolystoma xenopodis]